LRKKVTLKSEVTLNQKKYMIIENIFDWYWEYSAESLSRNDHIIQDIIISNNTLYEIDSEEEFQQNDSKFEDVFNFVEELK